MYFIKILLKTYIILFFFSPITKINCRNTEMEDGAVHMVVDGGGCSLGEVEGDDRPPAVFHPPR